MRIPCFPNRRYLSGLDWIIHGLDSELKRTTGIGALSQVILELDSTLDAPRFADAMGEFASKCPALSGRLARDITLAPYWRPARARDGSRPVLIRESQAPDRDSALSILARDMATPLPANAPRIAFHLVHGDQETDWLGMRFDHRVFDAGGAELFLRTLTRWLEDPEILTPVLDRAAAEPARLEGWNEKFQAGRQLQIALAGKSKLNAAQPDLTRCRQREPGYDYRMLNLCPDETTRVLDLAEKEAGPLLLMPYLLAASARAFAPSLGASPATGKDLLIPVSLDTRPRGEPQHNVFFNHASFAILTATSESVTDRAEMVAAFRDDFYRQLKAGFPKHVRDASLLMRILPRFLAKLYIAYPMQGNTGSFCFGYLGESTAQDFSFRGARVTNVFHTPRTPSPATGCFFLRCKGKLNAIITARSGLFPADTLEDLARRLKDSLLHES